MCRCPGESSGGSSLKLGNYLLRELLKERGRDSELSFSEPDRTLLLRMGGKRPYFSYGLITSAEHNSLTALKFLEVMRKMGLGFMNIQFNHGPILNYILN
jgi:hypothetical protein